MRRILYLWLSITLGLLSHPLYAQISSSGTGDVANDYIGVYQRYLSGLKNTTCSMYPSCSNYAKMVFSDYPFPVAMIKTAERLSRCGNDLSFYPASHIRNYTTAVDYPENRIIPNNIIYRKPLPVSAGTIYIRDSLDTDIQFINSLINKQAFSSAMLEIERLLYYNPDKSADNSSLYVDKLKCYEGMKEYDKAVMEYESRFPQKIQNDYSVMYTAGHIYDLLGDKKNAFDLYDKASARIPEEDTVTPWGELAILYVGRDDLDGAMKALHNKFLADNNKMSYETSMNIVSQLKNTRYKNPAVAMTLGFIPGMGYLYTKQPFNALTALIINGALAYATYTSFKNKNYGLGGILGVLNLSFYIGNITGARSSAIRYNDTIKRNAINQLRDINPYIN